MILIEVHKPDGSLIGRCDARCYNAKHPKCDCVCGGVNHGRGFWINGAALDLLKSKHPENIVTLFGIQ
jgi:hypothetical protein